MNHVLVMDFKVRRWTFIIALVWPLIVLGSANGDSVRGIQSRVTHPIAPRGGVLMLPLTAERHGNHWPETIDLRFKDGRIISGQVAWIHPAPIRANRQWTDDPRWLLIRAVRPDDDSSPLANDPTMGPYLLAPAPLNAEGVLRLGKQTIEPFWRDLELASAERAEPGSPFAVRAETPTLTLAPSPDRPDPVSPFEYWRWVLLADRLELNPPFAFGGEIERMAAEHYAALWQIGLQRLRRLSARVAQQCRNMLTQTCIDRRQPFAAWIADPPQVATLLSILLDFDRSDAQVLSEVVTWIDNQSPLIFWPQSEYGDQITLAMATIHAEPMIATFHWLNTSEPPQSVRIEPGVLMQVTFARSPLPKPAAIGLPAPEEPAQQRLSIQAGSARYELVFGRRRLNATPPATIFPPLLPPLTLAEVQVRQQRVMPNDQSTFAHVRRLSGRWEIFIECRRLRHGDDINIALPATLTSLDDVRDAEAITVLLGADEDLTHFGDTSDEAQVPQQSRVWLTIPETGFWQLVRGENDGTLQIHRASYSDRWYCRIVLPDSWFSATQAHPGYIGFIRSHGDMNQVETGPAPSTPWRPAPGRAAINLDLWDDVVPSE